MNPRAVGVAVAVAVTDKSWKGLVVMTLRAVHEAVTQAVLVN